MQALTMTLIGYSYLARSPCHRSLSLCKRRVLLHGICVASCLDVISRGTNHEGARGASAVAPPMSQERADIPNMYLSLKVIPYSEKSSLVQIYVYQAKRPKE